MCDLYNGVHLANLCVLMTFGMSVVGRHRWLCVTDLHDTACVANNACACTHSKIAKDALGTGRPTVYYIVVIDSCAE